ncbi:NRDE family protein [Rubritalea sp.]|uniref:NRDE family protein n=1 Tax=Rubritalea sp. TaxID=2109375 RepID=UPI003EF9E2A0
MCTVSWQTAENLEEAELLLYFSRDEMRQRAPGSKPELFRQGGTHYLSPIDLERGGTWITANEHGCMVCLLNDYSVSFDFERKWESRGMLVRELAQFYDSDDVWRYFESKGDLFYPPFTLLFWDGKIMHQWHWNTFKLNYRKNVQAPFTSSSWQSERVEAGRIALFNEWIIEGGRSLESFHTHEMPGETESSVCMSRELTQTVSLTSVLVSRNMVLMGYTPRDQSGVFLGETNISLSRK